MMHPLQYVRTPRRHLSLPLLLIFFFTGQGAHLGAAIAPHEFQYKATEVLDLAVESVETENGRVTIEAKVLRIYKSTTADLEKGSTITIRYREKNLTERHSFWDRLFPKPGRQELYPPDLPAVGDQIQAYLKATAGSEPLTWTPAANQYSFGPAGIDPILR